MKVTFVVPGLGLSGGCRVIGVHATMLARAGHQVHVVVPPPTLPPWRDYIKGLIGRGMSLADVLGKLRRQRNEWDIVRRDFFCGSGVEVRCLDRPRSFELRDVPDSDVVVATYWPTAQFVATLPASKGAKVFFVQGFEVLPGERDPGMDAAWRLDMHKIVVSRWLADVASRTGGSAGISVVPNSIDTAQFFAVNRSKRRQPSLGLIYYDHPLKGLSVAMQVVERLKKLFPDLHLVAMSSWHPEPLPEFPVPAHHEYHFRPRQDAIREIYSNCDVWLCASRSEGYGLPPLEALACGTPVVSTAVGAVPDYLIEGRSGHVVPIDDVDALTRAAHRILCLSDAEWKEVSDAAASSACMYKWQDAGKLMERTLERMAQTHVKGS